MANAKPWSAICQSREAFFCSLKVAVLFVVCRYVREHVTSGMECERPGNNKYVIEWDPFQSGTWRIGETRGTLAEAGWVKTAHATCKCHARGEAGKLGVGKELKDKTRLVDKLTGRQALD